MNYIVKIKDFDENKPVIIELENIFSSIVGNLCFTLLLLLLVC